MSRNHHVLILPNRGWLRVDWAALWEYRDLLALLVRRDFLAKYRQTVLGPAWAVIQPVLMTLVFTVIFGRVAKLPTDGVPPTLFYLCGLLGWNYFAHVFTATGSSLVANARLYGKVYFPRLIIPVASVFSQMVGLSIQLATFLAFYVWFKVSGAGAGSFGITPAVVFLPLIIAHTAVLSLGVGLWMSSLTAKYRDLQHLTAFLVQLWMYATPVIYPLSMLPERLRGIALLNPMTAPIETYKAMLLGAGSVGAAEWGISIGITLLLFFSGLLTFQRVERTFVDTV